MPHLPHSFWFDDLPHIPALRAPLFGAQRADVAIIGAGYSGLWCAYYLKRAAPHLQITVVEKHRAGFGASGRNGGWLTGGFAWSPEKYAASHGVEATRAFIAALGASVGEVIEVARREGIEADIVETEELNLARNIPQRDRLLAEIEARQAWGEELDWLDRSEATARLRVPNLLGATALKGVARIQPAKLVLGLAARVEALGVTIFEQSEVTEIAPERLATPQGELRAPIILRCTEGFTPSLAGHKRLWLPLNSAQVITEPLPEALWERIGWEGRELLGTADHLYAYCQRTREGRIAVGGRGLPYRFGSRFDEAGRPDPVTTGRLLGILKSLFPEAAALPIAQSWGGVLGVPRDWCASVGLGPQTGLGWAGGYVGVGVSTSNLAARTLCDLVLGRDTALTHLPWVGRLPRNWEPEPLRWLGVSAMYAMMAASDRAEYRSGKPSRLAAWGMRLTGRA